VPITEGLGRRSLAITAGELTCFFNLAETAARREELLRDSVVFALNIRGCASGDREIVTELSGSDVVNWGPSVNVCVCFCGSDDRRCDVG